MNHGSDSGNIHKQSEKLYIYHSKFDPLLVLNIRFLTFIMHEYIIISNEAAALITINNWSKKVYNWCSSKAGILYYRSIIKKT